MLCVNGITFNMGLAHSPSIISDGLVLYLDAANLRSYSGSGNTANGLVGNISGSLVNGVGFTSSNNGSFVFDGTNDYIVVPHSTTISASTTNTFTLSAWFLSTVNGTGSTLEIVNKRNNTAGPTYVSYGLSWYRASSSDSVFARLGFTDNSVNDLISSVLSQNQWYFVVETFDSTNHKLYINGILDKSSSVTGKTILDDGFPLTINSYTGVGEFLAGKTSFVQLYNRALTEQEILQNYNATRKRFGL